jgi:Secretion system C-terminal sorting domain
VVITQNDQSTTAICGNTGQIITRTWTAMDACGNQKQATQSITVAEDEIAPVFAQQLANLEMTAAEYQSWQGANLTASDNCNAPAIITHSAQQIDNCNYAVSYLATDACGNFAVQLQYIHINNGQCAPTGTQDLAAISMKIYPNPATSLLTVETVNGNVPAGTRYDVVDNLGRILIAGDLNLNRTDLKVNQLAASNYFLRIYLTKEPLVFKFEKM